MVLRWLFLLCVLALYRSVFGQEDTLVAYPKVLSEVTIRADAYAKYSTSGNYRTLQLSQINITLGEALNEEPSVYFKTYGNRQLTTISFRGTNANHTSVLWNGIPANYPTLGQLDFSQYPMWFVSSVGIQPGNGGSLYGNGAIGGAVVLESALDEEEIATLHLAAGSFGRFETGVSTSYGSQKWSANTKAYTHHIANDFSYMLDGREITQQNAAVIDQGVQQQIGYRISCYSSVVAVAHFTENDREIQPTKLSPDLSQQLNTKNWRSAITYRQVNGSSAFITTLAHLRNDQVFNTIDRTVSDQLSALVSYEYDWTAKLSTRSGFNINRFSAKADNFTDELEDWQIDVFNALEYRLAPKWLSKLNIRYSNYDGMGTFTPSIGQEFTVHLTSAQLLLFNANWNTGFRYPTLNDRYWSPGGNPDLKPETSQNLEATSRYEWTKNQWLLKAGATYFQTWSDNWILWRPTAQGFWSPENIQSVIARGAEVEIDMLYTGELIHGLKMSYSYTRSEDQQLAAQLPYTPIHNATAAYMIAYKDWKIKGTGNFTGRRYTTLDNTVRQSVDDFLLWNLTVSRRFQLSGLHISSAIACNNLFDSAYENISNLAMPGRNYQLSFKIHLNKSNP